MKILLILSLLITSNCLSQIFLQELDNDLSHPYSYQMAIVDKNGNTLFTEIQNEDKQIVGYGNDFILVFRYSTNTIYVKNLKGVVISGFKIPDGAFFDSVNFSNMSDHEQEWVRISKTAFVIQYEDGSRKTFNKFCKIISDGG